MGKTLAERLEELNSNLEICSKTLAQVEARAEDREKAIATYRRAAIELGADPDNLEEAIKQAQDAASADLEKAEKLLETLMKDIGVGSEEENNFYVEENDPYNV